MKEKIHLQHFSDVLCIWAYISQVRIQELRRCLGEDVSISYHYLALFASARSKIENSWQDKGGFEGFADHLAEVMASFSHVELNADVWRNVQPTSCTTSHLFLKAIDLLQAESDVSWNGQLSSGNISLHEEAVWQIRLAWFKDARRIDQQGVLFEIAEELGLDSKNIAQKLADGSAYAALNEDRLLQDKYAVRGSPTYVLDNGRQVLFGNVGYKVLEANIRELQSRPGDRASWC